MPDGVVMWVDLSAGEAGIRRRRRQYVARVADVEPPARHVEARVHFDIRRHGGAETAGARTGLRLCGVRAPLLVPNGRSSRPAGRRRSGGEGGAMERIVVGVDG